MPLIGCNNIPHITHVGLVDGLQERYQVQQCMISLLQFPWLELHTRGNQIFTAVSSCEAGCALGIHRTRNSCMNFADCAGHGLCWLHIREVHLRLAKQLVTLLNMLPGPQDTLLDSHTCCFPECCQAAEAQKSHHERVCKMADMLWNQSCCGI